MAVTSLGSVESTGGNAYRALGVNANAELTHVLTWD